jgi:hypothetical protein
MIIATKQTIDYCNISTQELYFLDKSAILEDEIFSGKYTLYEFRTIAQRF